jgi:hypothetical protein
MTLRTLIGTNTVIVGDLNTSLPTVVRSSRLKINKETFRATPHIRPNRHGHTAENPMGDQSNKGRNQKVPGIQ